jgi:enoyl-CoA hydratase
LISVETRGPVAVIRLARGKANAMDTDLCREITARFGGLADSGHRAAVLTGDGPMFSAGVDLLRLRDGGTAYLDEFLPALSEAFLAVFDSPVPVVAAVNGHAIAGGCVLACACDHRVMNAEQGRMGVTELLVGVPFPVTPLEILRFAVGTHRLKELTYYGRTYPAGQALRLGLTDEAVPAESVLARAAEVAGELAALPAEALRHTRRQLRGPALERISRDRAADDAVVREMWASAEAQEKLTGYVSKTLRA